ncbi:alpha/beta fold hydrolase [Georgenia faecalis]|uniref:alpha/beta fold hydrolase n=1 Tax=Georgenia faecalis TaxID=2483799 RepID=UPI000FD8E6BD|nr:alpha/beta hydrolase [Georgenia faecalis]
MTHVVARLRSLPATTRPGPGQRPYVLVHGIGTSSRYFRPLAAELRRTGPVHAVELPGFGPLPRPDRTLTMAELGDVVHTVLVGAGIADAVLVGHSMGAQVVVETLVRHPGVARTAALIGPTTNPAEATAVRQGLRLAQSGLHDSWAAGGVVASDYARAGLRWYTRMLRVMLDHPLEERLPLVDADVLVLRGQHDTVAPPAWVDRVVELLPRGQGAIVAGGGHAVMYDRPRAVAALVRELAED